MKSPKAGRTGRYRLRTAIRERGPWWLAARIPKGSKDCGDHEWYRHDEGTWRCYHCVPGVTRSVPWDNRELQRRQEATEDMLRLARYLQPGDTDKAP